MQDHPFRRSRKTHSGNPGPLPTGKDPGSPRRGASAGDAVGDLESDPASQVDQCVARLQRSKGTGRISFKSIGNSHDSRTAIEDLEQSGCIRLRMPRPEPRVAPSAVIINTAGGLTDGDEITLAATWAPGTMAAITSQAAERVYRARAEPARIETTLSVGAGATGLWLPQETILYDGARLDRRLSVEMAASSTLSALEMTVFGRAASGETLRSGSFRDRWDIRVGGRLVFAERVRLDGDITGKLERLAIGGGAGAVATLVHVAPGAADRLAQLRAALTATNCDCGATAIGDTLVARLLGQQPAAVRDSVAMALTNGLGLELPRSWTL